MVKRFVSDEYDDIEVEDAVIHIDSASSLMSKNLARLIIPHFLGQVLMNFKFTAK